jgi:thioredoxin-like negative regulator of GroEL
MQEVDNKIDLTKHLSQNKRVLALFSSSWCPFCQRFTGAFNKNVGNYKFDLILCVNLDDSNSPLWEEYSVEAVPTLILFENGEIVSRLDAGLGVGLNEKQLVDWLKRVG